MTTQIIGDDRIARIFRCMLLEKSEEGESYLARHVIAPEKPRIAGVQGCHDHWCADDIGRYWRPHHNNLATDLAYLAAFS